MPDDPGSAEDRWLLSPAEQALVATKNRANRLGFAILLTFFRERGRFPRDETEVEAKGIAALSEQLDASIAVDGKAFLTGRTAERLRSEIRARFGFREATVADAEALTVWLRDHIAAEVGGELARMLEQLELHCRELAAEPPTPERMERIARSALRAHEDRFHNSVYERLPPATRERLDALLRPEKPDIEADADDDRAEAPDRTPAVLLQLRDNPGRPSLASLQDTLEKLEVIRSIDLPADLFDGASPRELERCRQRVSVEVPRDLRRHPEAARITWLAAFVYLRARSLTDDLVDVLIETIHKIGARAERKVERELLDDLKRVSGKQNLLFELADAALAQPDGVVREVVFPVVSEQTLQDLVKEWKATGPTYRVTLRTVIRNSYRGHYRRMVPTLLAALEFRSNNERHQPVMEALDLVKRFATTKVRTFPVDEAVPLDGVVRGLWRDAVIEKDAAGRERVNRVTYEIAVLEALRERLRCKEIWVVGANRYGNPDDDLPTDFEANREAYYRALKLPMDAERFIAEVQAEMDAALTTFDAGLKKNRFVRLSDKGGGWITLTPLDAQPEPPNLTALKAELNATWPMTSLLDMVKETELRLGFTDVLKSPTAYEALEHDPLVGTHRGAAIHTAGETSGGPRLLEMLAYVEQNLTPGEAVGPETWIAYARGLDQAFATHKRKVGLVQQAGCTSHMSAVDGEGNMAALTYTLLSRFGSGVVLPQTGILMNNSVSYFDPRPGNPISIAGGQRINASNMCPTIAARDGAALFAVGASGANRIVPCTAQITALLLDYGLSLEEAFHTPRVDASSRGSVRADPAMGEPALAELRKVFEVEVGQLMVFPKLYSCPSGVMRDPADGTCWGMADKSSPISGAATPAPFSLDEVGVKADQPRA